MDLQVWVKKGKDKLCSFGIKEWGMVLAAGICCLIIVFPTEKGNVNNRQENDSAVEKVVEKTVGEEKGYVEQLEQRLEELLSGVEGVGSVRVMITVDGSTQKTILQDGTSEREQTTETDSAGGSRNSVSERSDGTTVFYTDGSESVPYILSENYPKVTGVVVIAKGSGTGTVDFDILNAVQVLFDVPAHKIKIMKMK